MDGHTIGCCEMRAQRLRHTFDGYQIGVQALILVDMQRDFFAAGALHERKDRLVDRTNQIIAMAEKVRAPVIVVSTIHDPDGNTWALNMREDNAGVAIEGSEGALLLDGIVVRRPIPVRKTRDSAFLRTDLEDLLHDMDVEHIVLAGVSTEACIAVTAADAYARDFRVTLASDAIASTRPDMHRPALDWLATQYRQHSRDNDAITFAPPGARVAVD